MGKFRLVYGKDPHAAEHGGAAFFWPENEQLRRHAEMVRRMAPDVFETVYQCNPLGAARIRQQRAEARARLDDAHRCFLAAAERLVAAHGALADAPPGDARALAGEQLTRATREVVTVLAGLGLVRRGASAQPPAA